jgi:RNA polymerase sigma factor (sigma-70 family)
MDNERLRVELRFKNATLFNALLEVFPSKRRPGFPDLVKAASSMGISYSDLCGLVSLTLSPWRADGTERTAAGRVAEYLKRDAEFLFPIRLYSGIIPKRLAREIDGSRWIGLLEAQQQRLLPMSTEDLEGTIDSIDRDDLRHTVDSILKTLTPREEKVLRARFGFNDGEEETLEKVGCRLEIFKQRVSQIQNEALRKLRHPNRSRHLVLYYKRGMKLERKQPKVRPFESWKEPEKNPLLICSKCNKNTKHRQIREQLYECEYCGATRRWGTS